MRATCYGLWWVNAKCTSPNERSKLLQRGWDGELSMNIAVNVGLVFAVPLADKMFGFGQLIAWQRPIFYVAGYDKQFDNRRRRKCRSPVLRLRLKASSVSKAGTDSRSAKRIPKNALIYNSVRITVQLFLRMR